VSAFGSGHDPRVLGLWSTEACLSLSLCLPLCLLVLSLLFYKVNKIFLKNAKGKADFRVG